MLQDGDGTSVRLITPELEPLQVKMLDNQAQLRPTGMDNYHALVARREDDARIETAIRYVYMNGKPSGHSPAELTAYKKSDLEIIPLPLPREHRRYLSGTQIAFEVRYHGWSLNQVEVVLTTSNGSMISAMTDLAGQVRFQLPDDFRDVQAGRQNNDAAELVLQVDYDDKGKGHTTRLSMPYYVNPAHWQSNRLAMAMAAGGFITGIGLMGYSRRRQNNKE